MQAPSRTETRTCAGGAPSAEAPVPRWVEMSLPDLKLPSEVVELRERNDEYRQRTKRNQSAQPGQAKAPDQIRLRWIPFPASLRPGVQMPDDGQDRERQSHQRYQTQAPEDKTT